MITSVATETLTWLFCDKSGYHYCQQLIFSVLVQLCKIQTKDHFSDRLKPLPIPWQCYMLLMNFGIRKMQICSYSKHLWGFAFWNFSSSARYFKPQFYYFLKSILVARVLINISVKPYLQSSSEWGNVEINLANLFFMIMFSESQTYKQLVLRTHEKLREDWTHCSDFSTLKHKPHVSRV